jgi:hypothetical protein
MSKKEITLVVFTLLLVAVYLGCFTDWLRAKPIRIEHAVRPNVTLANRQRDTGSPANPPAYTLTFFLGRECRLTSIKVVPAAGFVTNRDVPPLWHLVGDARSVPTRFIVYGAPVEGMKPSLSGSSGEPLASGIEYRLLVEAGRSRGEHEFKIAGPAAAAKR